MAAPTVHTLGLSIVPQITTIPPSYILEDGSTNGTSTPTSSLSFDLWILSPVATTPSSSALEHGNIDHTS